MPADLPCSSNSYSSFNFLYLIPFLMRNPTPLLPLKAYSKLAPCHSYPLIVSSYLSLKCVSDSAITSGFSRSMNCMILYFFAVAPFTLTCMIFMFCLSSFVIFCLVIRKNSFKCVCLCWVLSYLLGCILIAGNMPSSYPRIHLFIRLTCEFVSGGPYAEFACFHICGKYRSWLVKFHSYLISTQS